MGSAILLLALGSSVYIAWSIGANDETMATVAGSGFLTPVRAVKLGAMMNFLGAVFMGGRVEKTLGEGILAFKIGLTEAFIIILAVATWLTLASSKGWPVSTTHSAVGAAIGIGFALSGIKGIRWKGIEKVAVGWILSPALGMITSFLLYFAFSRFVISKAKGLRDRDRMEFSSALILTFGALVTAFSRGANDVGNATAFLSVVLGRPLLIRVIGGGGMALGLYTLGRKVIESVGLQIIRMSPGMALIAQISTAIIMFVGTWFGLPISGTHVLVASIAGMAMAKRARLNLRELWGIVFSWIATFPAAALISFAAGKILIWLA